MRQSSNNHKVPTVLLGQEEAQFSPDNQRFNIDSWLSFEQGVGGPDLGQAVNDSSETVDLDADYWQPASPPASPSQETPHPESPPRHSRQNPGPHSEQHLGQNPGQHAYTADNLFYEEDFLISDGVDADGEAEQALEDEWIHPEVRDSDDFDADLFADDFTEQAADLRGRFSRSRHRERQIDRYPDRPVENLDYLFGEHKPERNRPYDSAAQRRNGHAELAQRNPPPSKQRPIQRQPLEQRLLEQRSVEQRFVEQRPTKQLLEHGFLKAVMAAGSPEYFKAIAGVLSKASAALPSDTTRLPSGLQIQLSTLTLLVKRYATCRLTEHAVLEDVIELYTQFNSTALLPVLAGLATRIVLKPHLENGLLSPPLIQRLFGAVAESIKLLSVRRQLKALPGLVARLSQLPVEDRHTLNQLPQQLDRATLQATQNPQLYQRLCRYSEEISTTRTASNTPSNIPQRLQIDGPVEIFFRRLDQ